MYDTQLNESLNNCVAVVAPKNRTYCCSLSFKARVHIFIGQHSYGYLKYWKPLIAEKFGIEISPEFLSYLKHREVTMEYHQQ